MASFNWTKVVEKFESSFDVAFANFKNRAHFDNLSKEFEIIAGSNTPWSKLLLLDAVIHVITNDTLISSPRRAFDQNRILCDSVVNELRIIALEVHKEYEVSPTCVSSGNSKEPKPDRGALRSNLAFSLSAPWDTISNLRDSMLTGQPGEPVNKFDKLVGMLTSHPALKKLNFDMQLIAQQLVRRVITLFRSGAVGGASPPVPPVSNVDPLINSTVSFTSRSHHHTAKRKRDGEDGEKKNKSVRIDLPSTHNVGCERVSILKAKEPSKRKRSAKATLLKAQAQAQTIISRGSSSEAKTDSETNMSSLPSLSLVNPSSISDEDNEEDENDNANSSSCDNNAEGGVMFDTQDSMFFRDSSSNSKSSSSKSHQQKRQDSTNSSDCGSGSEDGGGSKQSDETDESGMSSLTDNSTKRESSPQQVDITPDTADCHHNNINSTNNGCHSRADKSFVSADPDHLSYVMVDNVLCAVLPLVDQKVTRALNMQQQKKQMDQCSQSSLSGNSGSGSSYAACPPSGGEEDSEVSIRIEC